MFLQANGSLVELGHRRFIPFLVADCVCYKFVTVTGIEFKEDYDLYFFLGKRFRKCLNASVNNY